MSKRFIFGKAFTLPEILLVIAIIAILMSFIIPLGLDFYKSQQLETQSRALVQVLRRAQLKSASIELNSSFGVYLTENNYTLFKGDSYFTRDVQQDEVFDLPEIVRLSGLSEIVFLKSEGKPDTTGNINLSTDSLSRTININSMGRINLQ